MIAILQLPSPFKFIVHLNQLCDHINIDIIEIMFLSSLLKKQTQKISEFMLLNKAVVQYSCRSAYFATSCRAFSTGLPDPAKFGEFLNLCRTDGGSGSIDLTQDSSTGIAEIKLNNPAKKNAVSGTMMLQLEEIVTKLEQWSEGKVVFLYGEKDSFCSGGDLEFVRKMATPELGYQMCTFMQHTLDRLCNLPLISITIVRGVAHGGGAELTTATDFRVFCRSADVKFVQARLNITTGWGGASRLARIIGWNSAFFHLASCSPITIANARTLGYCQLITKDLEGLEMGKAWYQDNFSKISPVIINRYKSLMRNVGGVPIEFLYAEEKRYFQENWGSLNHITALDSSLLK